MKRDLKRVARYVAARRGELGMTQDQLAERASVDRKTLYNLESGERWPHAATRGRIERALGWPPGDLARLAEGRESADRTAFPPGRVSAEERTPVDVARLPVPEITRTGPHRDLADIGPPGDDDLSVMTFSRKGGNHRIYVAWEGPPLADDEMDSVGEAFFTFSAMMRGIERKPPTRAGTEESDAAADVRDRRAGGER